ncbi:3-beta hydroxysteroid dehydrogenase [Nocardioides sp. InS609-2]|uniref:SDR family oxidoreductase n=1 Tax=Nocardioides sp. InS609-2 TaxID=2760705 RepID=UPI0020C05130|nr:3-beta hydroxysteroid dehydrogenase [Nocardioides sp. InS609-2]
MKVAVIGGAGLAGRHAVAALEAAGDEVVVLSRATGVDAVTGAGLDEGLAGVEVVIDAANVSSMDRDVASAFFTSVAGNLQTAGARAGVRRIVTLSIYGIDGLEGRGYFAAKLAQEEAARRGDVPSTILRATQFHDFGGQLMQWTRKGPVVGVPIQPVQTVAIETVAAHLVRLAHGDEDGTVNLAGPRPDTLIRQVRRHVRAAGKRYISVPLWLPGRAEKLIRAGALVPRGDAVLDGPDFETWLAAR